MDTKTVNQSRSVTSAQVVTITTTFDSLTRGFYVGTAGDLAITYANNETVTIKNASTGYHPHEAKAFQSGATTADNILALF